MYLALHSEYIKEYDIKQNRFRRWLDRDIPELK